MTADPPGPPALVSLTVWGVAPASVPRALVRMGLDRLSLRGTPGLRFARLLGTGDGRTFAPRDADPLHWALLAVWNSEAQARQFASSVPARAWSRFARERLDVALRPLASRGRWSGRQPFGDPLPRRVEGPVASITRARLRTTRARSFRRAVPAVSADLQHVPGLRLALGIGEAPVGLQGTFTLWSSAADLTRFAHRRAPHVGVIARTSPERWYTEELFARFEVLSVEGTFKGRSPLD